MGTGEWCGEGGKKTPETDICLFWPGVLPGVLAVLFPVSGRAGAWRAP